MVYSDSRDLLNLNRNTRTLRHACNYPDSDSTAMHKIVQRLLTSLFMNIHMFTQNSLWFVGTISSSACENSWLELTHKH